MNIEEYMSNEVLKGIILPVIPNTRVDDISTVSVISDLVEDISEAIYSKKMKAGMRGLTIDRFSVMSKKTNAFDQRLADSLYIYIRYNDYENAFHFCRLDISLEDLTLVKTTTYAYDDRRKYLNPFTNEKGFSLLFTGLIDSGAGDTHSVPRYTAHHVEEVDKTSIILNCGHKERKDDIKDIFLDVIEEVIGSTDNWNYRLISIPGKHIARFSISTPVRLYDNVYKRYVHEATVVLSKTVKGYDVRVSISPADEAYMNNASPLEKESLLSTEDNYVNSNLPEIRKKVEDLKHRRELLDIEIQDLKSKLAGLEASRDELTREINDPLSGLVRDPFVLRAIQVDDTDMERAKALGIYSFMFV